METETQQFTLKDARSVSLYPYNQSQIFLTLQKELQHFVTNNVFLDKTIKTQQQNKAYNIKNNLSEPGIESGTFRTQI